MVTGNKKIIKNIDEFQLVCYLDDIAFSYSIFNTNTKCFEKIQRFNIRNEKLEEIIDNNIELHNNWPSTLCAIKTTRTTFIPKPLFDKKNAKQYMKFLSPEENDETIQFNKQVFLDCYSVCSINRNLRYLLEEKFNNLKIKSSASLLVDYAFHLSKNSPNYLLMEVSENYFHIVYIHKKIFKFYNIFTFYSQQDFLYYFMNCIKELNIMTNKTTVNILSELDEENTLFSTLKEYIQIAFTDRPSMFLYRNNILEIPNHKHHNLFGQIICE